MFIKCFFPTLQGTPGPQGVPGPSGLPGKQGDNGLPVRYFPYFITKVYCGCWVVAKLTIS